MKKNDITWSIHQYERNYRKKMLSGHYDGQAFIADYYDYLWITPLSIWWAKINIFWRFKALLN